MFKNHWDQVHLTFSHRPGLRFQATFILKDFGEYSNRHIFTYARQRMETHSSKV